MNKILFFVCFILLSEIVYAQPLKYIGNPETLECREYIKGVIPEGFSEDIGDAKDFKDINQACAIFKCVSTGGTILVEEEGKILEKNLCRCPNGKVWNEEKGCVGADLITGEAVFVPEKTTVNYLAIIITLLIIVSFVIFIIKKVKK